MSMYDSMQLEAREAACKRHGSLLFAPNTQPLPNQLRPITPGAHAVLHHAFELFGAVSAALSK